MEGHLDIRMIIIDNLLIRERTDLQVIAMIDVTIENVSSVTKIGKYGNLELIMQELTIAIDQTNGITMNLCIALTLAI